jgi:hypothetical protein
MNVSREEYKKIVDVLNNNEKEIKSTLRKSSDHSYWKLEVLPSYDNVLGGYNISATATDVVGRTIVIDNSSIKGAKLGLKKLPIISKVKISPKYNKKMLTVIAIGLNPKLVGSPLLNSYIKV